MLKKKMGRGRKRGRKSCLDSSSSTLKIDTLPPPSSHRRPRGCLLLLSNESSHPSFPKEWRKKVVEMFSATNAPPPRDKKTFEYRRSKTFYISDSCSFSLHRARSATESDRIFALPPSSDPEMH